MDKIYGSNQKPLDKLRPDIDSDDERDVKDEFASGSYRYSYEKNEEQRRQKKERDDQRERMLREKAMNDATLDDIK